MPRPEAPNSASYSTLSSLYDYHPLQDGYASIEARTRRGALDVTFNHPLLHLATASSLQMILTSPSQDKMTSAINMGNHVSETTRFDFEAKSNIKPIIDKEGNMIASLHLGTYGTNNLLVYGAPQNPADPHTTNAVLISFVANDVTPIAVTQKITATYNTDAHEFRIQEPLGKTHEEWLKFQGEDGPIPDGNLIEILTPERYEALLEAFSRFFDVADLARRHGSSHQNKSGLSTNVSNI